jgi:hypothetical protein
VLAQGSAVNCLAIHFELYARDNDLGSRDFDWAHDDLKPIYFSYRDSLAASQPGAATLSQAMPEISRRPLSNADSVLAVTKLPRRLRAGINPQANALATSSALKGGKLAVVVVTAVDPSKTGSHLLNVRFLPINQYPPNASAVLVATNVNDFDILACNEINQMLFGLLPERLLLFWRINVRQSNTDTAITVSKHLNGVTVEHANSLTLEAGVSKTRR